MPGHPGYRTRQQQVSIRGTGDLLIRSLLDHHQFADPLGEAAALDISSAAWPLFGLLWPSAVQLAACMAARPLVAHERILEVGCGLALASLVSHRRGADVTASDCHPLAPAFLLHNIALNALPPLSYRHGHWSAALDAPAHALRPIVQGRFDLIIGSDVLYERDEPGHLSNFIQRHARPTAEVLIVEPDRGNRPTFNRRMAALGFALVETRLADDANYRGRLLRYRRRDTDAGYRP